MVTVAEVMPTLGAKYFTFPFLDHALAVLVDALIADIIAKT